MCVKCLLYFSFIAVVFVVDSSHRDRVSEAHSELAKLLTEKELRHALLLIFANKQVLVLFFFFHSLLQSMKFKLSESSSVGREWLCEKDKIHMFLLCLIFVK